jgi:hypothetical protein
MSDYKSNINIPKWILDHLASIHFLGGNRRNINKCFNQRYRNLKDKGEVIVSTVVKRAIANSGIYDALGNPFLFEFAEKSGIWVLVDVLVAGVYRYKDGTPVTSTPFDYPIEVFKEGSFAIDRLEHAAIRFVERGRSVMFDAYEYLRHILQKFGERVSRLPKFAVSYYFRKDGGKAKHCFAFPILDGDDSCVVLVMNAEQDSGGKVVYHIKTVLTFKQAQLTIRSSRSFDGTPFENKKAAIAAAKRLDDEVVERGSKIKHMPSALIRNSISRASSGYQSSVH